MTIQGALGLTVMALTLAFGPSGPAFEPVG